MSKQQQQAVNEPPHSDISEEVALGTMIMFNTSIVEIGMIIEPVDFYRPRNQRIFEHILKLQDEHKEITNTVLTESLKSAGMLDICNGETYLDKLLDESLSTKIGVQHARIIKKYSLQRMFQEFGRDIYHESKKTEDIDEAIERAISRLVEMTESGIRTKTKPFSEAIPEYRTDYIRRMEEKRIGKTLPLGYQTGIKSLDEIIGGLRPESLNIISARPSVGKTALSLDIAINIATQGGFVLFVSREMSFRALVDRMLSRVTELNSFYINKLVNAGVDFDRLDMGFTQLTGIPFAIDNHSRTWGKIKTNIRRISHQFGPLGAVIIDYIQLIKTGDRSDNNLYERISKISGDLKPLAEEIKAPLVVLSQINREGASDPGMENLLGSGYLEQDADLILILDQDKCYIDKNPAIVDVKIAKHRNGTRGKFQLQYFKDVNKFVDYLNPDNYKPAPKPEPEPEDLESNFL